MALGTDLHPSAANCRSNPYYLGENHTEYILFYFDATNVLFLRQRLSIYIFSILDEYINKKSVAVSITLIFGIYCIGTIL